MDVASELTLRDMRESDKNYVLSSWVRSYSAHGLHGYVDHRDLCADYAPIAEALVARSVVRIACLRAEPDVIVGWHAREGLTPDAPLTVVHYLAVKPRWRRLGVASWMTRELLEMGLDYTHRTDLAVKFGIPPNWAFRPYLIWPRSKS
ncbi:MAG: hypothetical protein FWD69_10175 [Polyangiaceae bacterium]|nr:hypothetical protein [Polyangiaceae bacterium]